MIRKEAVQLSRPDPVAERRLADLRDRLAGLDAHVHSTSVAQLSAANTASSRAREEKYHRLHARLQTEEAMHKPFDKSWAIRECHKSRGGRSRARSTPTHNADRRPRPPPPIPYPPTPPPRGPPPPPPPAPVPHRRAHVAGGQGPAHL
jgi:hypothetical protein